MILRKYGLLDDGTVEHLYEDDGSIREDVYQDNGDWFIDVPVYDWVENYLTVKEYHPHRIVRTANNPDELV